MIHIESRSCGEFCSDKVFIFVFIAFLYLVEKCARSRVQISCYDWGYGRLLICQINVPGPISTGMGDRLRVYHLGI